MGQNYMLWRRRKLAAYTLAALVMFMSIIVYIDSIWVQNPPSEVKGRGSSSATSSSFKTRRREAEEAGATGFDDSEVARASGRERRKPAPETPAPVRRGGEEVRREPLPPLTDSRVLGDSERLKTTRGKIDDNGDEWRGGGEEVRKEPLPPLTDSRVLDDSERLKTTRGKIDDDGGEWRPNMEDLGAETRGIRRYSFLKDTKPMVYTIECQVDSSLVAASSLASSFSSSSSSNSSSSIMIHLLTDEGSALIWWQGSWVNALIKTKVLTGCKDADVPSNPDTPFHGLEVAVAMFCTDIVTTEPKDADFQRIVWGSFLSRQRRIRRQDLPVVILFTENPDLDMRLMMKFKSLLDSMQVGRRRFALSYNAAHTIPKDDGLLPKPTIDNDITMARFKEVFDTYDNEPGGFGHIRVLFWHSYWWNIVQDHSTACPDSMEQAANPPPPPLSKRPKTFLMLGGDARLARVVLLLKLFQRGLLKDGLWSLQTPALCCRMNNELCGEDEIHKMDLYHLPKGMRVSDGELHAFCALFPKTLDVKLDGGFADEEKDRTFAPQELYDQTRFSLVFESVISNSFNHTFLTEKSIKPIFRGHPFLLLCGTMKAAKMLTSFGFKSYDPVIDQSYDSDMNFARCTPDSEEDTVASMEKAAEMIENLARLDPKRWSELDDIVEHNRRHMQCGGFRNALIEHAKAILTVISSPLPPHAPRLPEHYAHDAFR